VNPEYKREDDRLSQDIESAKANVKAAVLALAAYWVLQSKLRKLMTSRDSLGQRVQALEKTLPQLSAEDQATVAYFDKANEFESKRIQASKHADQILQEVDALATELLSERDLKSDIAGDTDAVRQRYGDLYTSFSTGIEKLRTELRAERNTLSTAETAWAKKFKKARAGRDAVLEKLSEHKTVANQIIKLREEITDLTNQIGDLETQIKAAGVPASALTQAIFILKQANDRRTERIKGWASEIEYLSSGKIKAAVDVGGDTSEINEAVDFVASKTGSQEATRLRALEDALAADSASNVLDRLRADCLSLLYWRQMGAASGEVQPKCTELIKILGDTEKIRTSLTERIDTARVEAISAAVTKAEIALSYCDGDREISFEKASEGQRAAALLFMLLEQPGGPLIIDQPEGDLDNKIIADLTENLHSAKQNRQLIFASHNANIVVNGSSELVAHLDIHESGVREIACAGAIDMPAICSVITATMEGGEKAFKNRQDKYGY
jgi:type III restriction enzyme